MPMVGDDYSYAFIWDGANAGNLMDGTIFDDLIGAVKDVVGKVATLCRSKARRNRAKFRTPPPPS